MMDSSPPDGKPEFRKLSNDVASRKYRRHSTSSSDASPKRGRSSSPVIVRRRSDKVSDRTDGRKDDGREFERASGRHRSTRAGDSRRQHDRPSSRRSSHRAADDDDRRHQVSSHYGGRDAACPDHASEDNDHDRHRGRDGYDHRSRGDRMKDRERDHIGDRHLQSTREKDPHRSRESNENEDRELDALKEKEQLTRDPKKGVDDRDSLPKKAKLFDSSSDMDGKKNGGEHKPKAEQAQADTSDVANDLNAAKVAALKAAELVNKNLVGGGFMSTEQKKKLLWGNKKSTATEEVGPKWNTAMFGDRERQEKFNKLMGVKGDVKMDSNTDKPDNGDHLQVEKQKELQIDLEKQYTAGLRRRDGRTVGLGL